jgi:hypothetical protein
MSAEIEGKLDNLDEGIDLGDKPVRKADFSSKITAYEP